MFFFLFWIMLLKKIEVWVVINIEILSFLVYWYWGFIGYVIVNISLIVGFIIRMLRNWYGLFYVLCFFWFKIE